MTERSADDIRLLRSIALTKYAPLVGPPPAMVTDMVHDGLLEWRWEGGIPIYELTPAGHELLRTDGEQSRPVKEGK